MVKLYENIKQYREFRGFSQETLAKMTGYTDRSSIAKIESGLVDLQQSKIESFARALEVPVKTLWGWDEDKYTLTSRETSVVAKYRRLDEYDKGKIDERMDTMLESEKYKRGESSDVREIS